MTRQQRRMTGELARRFEREAAPYRDHLYQGALRMTRRPQDAEDLVQETMTRACAGFQRFQQGTNVRAWLQRIMKNAFISDYRRRQREPLVVTDVIEDLAAAWRPDGAVARSRPAEVQALERMPAAELTTALRELPPPYRTTVYLTDVEGYSYRESAAIMGVPVGTVMSRLHRGRGALRSSLGGLGSPGKSRPGPQRGGT